MDIFDKSYFRFNKVLMLCIGQWPYQPMYQRIIISIFLNIVNSSIFLALVSGIFTSKDFDDIVKIITAVIVCLLSSSKLNNSLFHAKKMRLLLDQIKSDWMVVSGPEIKILTKSAKTGRLLSWVYAVYVYFTLVCYTLSAYGSQILDVIKPINESRLRKRTYQSNYYIDPEKNYYLISFHEQFCSAINIAVLTTIDSMYVVYTEHICGMFGVLRYRLENILKDKSGNVEISENSLEENERVRKVVLPCISLHQKNVGYAKRLDSTFSTSLFFQIGLSMILLSITGYVTILKLGIPDEFIQFLRYTLGQIIYIFYNCLPGQKLIDASENIVKSVYNSQWYRLPLKTQKLFILLMVRSGRPCELQAGGVFILSLQTFSSCIQKSFSFFTVLLSMQE